MKRRFLLWILLAALFIQLAFPQRTNPRLLPFPEVHLGPNGEGAEGAVWLAWSDDQKLYFVNGFVQGFKNGWKASCSKSAELASANIYGGCIDARFQIDKPFGHYRDLASEFYTKYPEDLALPIDRLFSKLMEPEMTAQKVHQWLNELVDRSKKANSRLGKPSSK